MSVRPLHPVDAPREACLWDADLELALANFIDSHIANNPPPDEALYTESAQEWARNLRRAGIARREALTGERIALAEAAS